MFVIGIVLFAAAVVGVEAATVGSADVDVEVFGRVFATSTGVVFVAGVIAALTACLGLLLIADGWRRRARHHAERRELTAERDQLRLDAEHARADRPATEPEREHAVADHSHIDLNERADERDLGFKPVEPGERVDRPRHRLLHRSAR